MAGLRPIACHRLGYNVSSFKGIDRYIFNQARFKGVSILNLWVDFNNAGKMMYLTWGGGQKTEFLYYQR